jgi:hypothetical protein
VYAEQSRSCLRTKFPRTCKERVVTESLSRLFWCWAFRCICSVFFAEPHVQSVVASPSFYPLPGCHQHRRVGRVRLLFTFPHAKREWDLEITSTNESQTVEDEFEVEGTTQDFFCRHTLTVCRRCFCASRHTFLEFDKRRV